MNFDPYPSSLLRRALKRKTADSQKITMTPDKKVRINDPFTGFLGSISCLYLYTGTPPHGYGTQAPKVAETINRAYSFNKKVRGKKINIFGRDIERLHWEKKDGPFPFNEIHGNFIPSEARSMIENFLSKNCPLIDQCSDNIIKTALHSNADILTSGKQTFCPFTNQSVTASIAYKRMYDFLTENSGRKCISCLEWIQSFFSLFDKQSIEYLDVETKIRTKNRFCVKTKLRVKIERKVGVLVKRRTNTPEETNEKLLEISTRFASYIKHKERGKKDRRAIASANMILRMFLHIIEEFHLALSKEIEGATISIGGEEKKAKITNNMTTTSLGLNQAIHTCQGTEDATKWNECLSPSMFAMMHFYFFDESTRTRLGLPQPSEYGILFSKIAVAGNFLMSMKEIQLGNGVIIQNENEYSRLEWTNAWYQAMNAQTRNWFDEARPNITADGKYLKASPGMLMGMLNAGSTTIGLLATNHNMDKTEMSVMTLRSSDDSMSLYQADSPQNLKICVEMNKRNLEMLGINLSPDKTFFFREGLGEYTSWYMHENFVSQFGVETASIRPQGKNPQDDFYAVAKSTATSLSTLTINHLGAAIRLRLGIDGTRRLWKIPYLPGKRENISGKVQLLADGGEQVWNCTNCHLEETSLKERYCTTEEEKRYLMRIRNPLNPFAPEPSEEMTYSKEHGCLILETIETPRTCFNFLKKSNRTFNAKEKKDQEESEKAHHEAAKIIKLIDPTTSVMYPTSNVPISSHLAAILRVDSEDIALDEEEAEKLKQALALLESPTWRSLIPQENDETRDISYSLMEDSD